MEERVWRTVIVLPALAKEGDVAMHMAEAILAPLVTSVATVLNAQVVL